jgi:CHAD domain-containing protein
VEKVPAIRKKGSTKQSRQAAAAVAAAGAVLGGKLAWDKLSSQHDDERAYRLHLGEHIPDGVRRIARGQLDYASEQLEKSSDRKIGEAVHETRKSLKRLRALVRAARAPLGDTRYRRENADFRETGRLLSGARDSKVLIDTLDTLNERAADEISPENTAELRSIMEADHERALGALKDDKAVVNSSLAKLKAARRRTARWTFEADGFDVLMPGIERIYRRGRNRMRAAVDEPNPENLHEWRKRVKDLWHAAQIARSASPKQLKKFGKRAHRLSDLLGDDHDLVVLRDYIESHPQCFRDTETMLALVALIDRRRKALQQQALELGKSVFKQTPKRFARDLERGWEGRSPKPSQPSLA